MADLFLAVMVFAFGDYVSYISALYGIIAVLIHQVVSFIHVAIVVVDSCRCFMVHHQFDSLAVSIFV